MEVQRTYPCRHEGKLYGEGDTVEVPDEIGKKWIQSGSAVMPEPKKKKADADAKAKADARAKEQEAGKVPYTEAEFRSLDWDKARGVAGKLYQVQDNSWDGLTKEFMAAQKRQEG